ncbi:hypothetical protein HDU93_002296, partial [Gonapodya sp. JEL0774]
MSAPKPSDPFDLLGDFESPTVLPKADSPLNANSAAPPVVHGALADLLSLSPSLPVPPASFHVEKNGSATKFGQSLLGGGNNGVSMKESFQTEPPLPAQSSQGGLGPMEDLMALTDDMGGAGHSVLSPQGVSVNAAVSNGVTPQVTSEDDEFADFGNAKFSVSDGSAKLKALEHGEGTLVDSTPSKGARESPPVELITTKEELPSIGQSSFQTSGAMPDAAIETPPCVTPGTQIGSDLSPSVNSVVIEFPVPPLSSASNRDSGLPPSALDPVPLREPVLAPITPQSQLPAPNRNIMGITEDISTADMTITTHVGEVEELEEVEAVEFDQEEGLVNPTQVNPLNDIPVPPPSDSKHVPPFFAPQILEEQSVAQAENNLSQLPTESFDDFAIVEIADE